VSAQTAQLSGPALWDASQFVLQKSDVKRM
jgi:hypothetical protein